MFKIRSKIGLVFAIVILVLILTIYGSYQSSDFLSNVKHTKGTITKITDVSGDRRAYKGGKFYPVYKINYVYFVDGLKYFNYSVIGTEDYEYGFPLTFKVHTNIMISYHGKKPTLSKPRSKLKLVEDKTRRYRNMER